MIKNIHALPRGVDLLSDPVLNKGSAFTPEERDVLGLRGLLPPRAFSLQEQADRNLLNLRKRSSAVRKMPWGRRNSTPNFRQAWPTVGV